LCRLWHQLTEKVDQFFDHPLAKPYRVDVYTRFVRDFEERLNPLRLAEMGIKISQDIDSAPVFFVPCPRICPVDFQSAAPAPDPAQHLAFLTDLLSRISQDKSPDAHVLVLSTLAHAKLLFGDLEGSKTDIDAAWKILDNLDAVDNSVNGAYYRVAADYYKVRVVGVKASTSPLNTS
jgi:26S proteasome regulatory subunit N9